MMSIIDSIKKATVLMVLLECTASIQTPSFRFDDHISQPTNLPKINLIARQNRNPFRRPKVPGGGHLRTINEIPQIQT